MGSQSVTRVPPSTKAPRSQSKLKWVVQQRSRCPRVSFVSTKPKFSWLKILVEPSAKALWHVFSLACHGSNRGLQPCVNLVLGLFLFRGLFLQKYSTLLTIGTALNDSFEKKNGGVTNWTTPEGQPFSPLFSLFLPLWAINSLRGSSSQTPRFFKKNLWHFWARLTEQVPIAYRIIFIGLDRRMRKIIKNKYRFRRQYVCVPVEDRLRYGLHLLKFCVRFTEGRTWVRRVTALLEDLFFNKDESMFLGIRQRQQRVVLSALHKQYILM